MERVAIFNTFLAFEVNTSATPDELIMNPEEYPGLFFEFPGDPVNLLTGSFSWNYTDFALYGREELDFIRYYESTAFEDDHHFGRGWSTSFTHELSVDLLYADFTIPGDKHIYFVMTPDGTYSAKAGSAFSLEATDDSYIIRHKDGTTYLFSRDDSKVEQDIQTITYLDGSTTEYSYSGGLVSRVSNNTGSFTFSYSGDHVTSVTDSVGRSIRLSYDGDLLTAVENPDSDSLRYFYDAEGRVERIENFNGEVYLDNTYDEEGRVLRQYVKDQGTFIFTYDAESRTNTCTGENGYFLSITYDEKYRIVSSTNSESTKTIEYDEYNRRVRETDRSEEHTSELQSLSC